MSHITLRTGDGQLLGNVPNITRWQYARQSNDIGWFRIECAELDKRLLNVDRILEFYRTVGTLRPILLGVGFLRSWEWKDQPDGSVQMTLEGPDQIDLIARRVVAYNTEAYYKKTDYADDMIKAIVRENMGTLALDPWYSRGRAYDSSLFTVAPDEGQGRSVTKTFQYRNTLEAIKDAADASTWPSADNNWIGVPIYFDLEYVGPAEFVFKTYANRRGIDRTIGTNSIAPIIFSQEAGNLSEPSLKFDYSEEQNIVYGLGPGQGEDRMVDPENDVPRERLSPWNLREGIVPATEESTLLGVAWHAYQAMQDRRPRVVFSGKLVDTPTTRFGVDWGFGDEVTVRYQGFEFDGKVDSFVFTVEPDGRELLEATVSITKALEGHPD